MSPRVSVVLATYNRAHYIAESLESLLRQTMSPDEIIVVDDGSVDETAAIVNRFGSSVRYIRKPNGGRSSALNLGLQLAEGDWIWFFDDDDVALPESLAVRISALASRPDADVVYSGQLVGHDGPDSRIVAGHTVLAPVFDDSEILLGALKQYSFRLQGMLIRKSRLLDIGGFDEDYLRSQDYELYTRLFQDCKVIGLSTPTFIWRNHLGLRGAAAERHDGSQRDAVWMEYDGRLGRKVRAEFPLGMYLAPPQRTDDLPGSLRRLALFNRLAVMASKGLLAEMLSDLTEAVALGSEDLSNAERLGCANCVLSPYFIDALLRKPDAFLSPIAGLRERVSLQVIGCFARGMLYAARTSARSNGERRRLAALAIRLARFAGVRAVFYAYMASSRPQCNPGDIDHAFPPRSSRPGQSSPPRHSRRLRTRPPRY